MWVFKTKFSDSYLAANPKVLTQTLLRQSNIERFKSKSRYLHFFLKEIHVKLGPEYVMLVRNPYFRVESYYREKLNLKVRQVLDVDPYILKRHQQIFYPVAGIKESDTLETKRDRLLALDFKTYVKTIPSVYEVEDHLAPQTYNFTRRIFGISRTMKMNKYVHIEHTRDMVWAANYFKLDLSIRVNESTSTAVNIEWDRECIEITQRIYQKDFETFGYPMEYPIIL